MSTTDFAAILAEHQKRIVVKGRGDVTRLNRATFKTALQCIKAGLPVAEVHSIDAQTGVCTCQYNREKRIAEGGIVAPCAEKNYGKHPRGGAWQKRKTLNPEHVVARWVGKSYPINVGVVYGKDVGVASIDVDGPAGEATMVEWQTSGLLPPTVTVVTGSGGRHLYYRVPDGWDIRNSVKTIGAGMDVRGENGFSVAPGSRHYSGIGAKWQDGVGVYKWLDGHSPDDIEIADAPPELLRKLWFATLERRHLTAPDGSKWEDAGLKEQVAAAAVPVDDADVFAQAAADIAGSGGGWEAKVALIGYGEGSADSFDHQIYVAACSYFGTLGYEADEKPFVDACITRAGEAGEDVPGKRDRYVDPEYYPDRISAAREYVKSKGGEPDRSYRAAVAAPSAITETSTGFASQDGMNAAIDALGPHSTDRDVKAIMRAMCASPGLSDAVLRMGVRRIARRLADDDRDMAYCKAMWNDVAFQVRHPMPPALSTPEVVAKYMSSRYAGVRWGKNFDYVDTLQPHITPYSTSSLKEEYKRTFVEVVIKGKDGTPKTVRVPNWFVWWSENCDIPQYDEVMFAPKGYVGDRQFNLFRLVNLAAVSGDWNLLRRHLFLNVCAGNPYKFAYFMYTLASWVQNPHRKDGVAIGIRGSKGSGKSKVGEWIAELFPHNNAVVSSPDELYADFNVHLAYAIIVVGNEAFWAGSKAQEGQLKAAITDPTQWLHPKGVDRVQIRDCRHFLFTTNEDHVFPATEGERRFYVLDMQNNGQTQNSAYFAAIDDQMEAGGLEAMRYELLHLATPAYIDLRNPPKTDALKEQISHTARGYDAAWEDIVRSGVIRLPPDNDGNQEEVPWGLEEPCTIDRDDLRLVLEDVVCRTKAHVKNPTSFGIWLKKRCGGDVAGGLGAKKAENDGVYVLPPRQIALKIADIDLDEVKLMGQHRFNPSDPSDKEQAVLCQRLARASGFDGTVEIPDKVPMEALASWRWWGFGLGLPKPAT